MDLLLKELLKDIKSVLGEKLVGLYVYGSFVWGDFDPDISDIDMLAALSEDLTDKELKELEQIHTQFAQKHKEWEGRIEVQYYSLDGLKNFRTRETKMGNISPGEPLHFVQAGKDWLINWYFVLTYGKTLYGPVPSTIIEPISKEEYLQTIRDHVKFWQDNIPKAEKSKPYQGYVIMTMCRALYSLTHGEQVSKKKAADWVKEKYPEWKDLINEAFVWRKNVKQEQPGAELTYPKTVKFVNFAINEIENQT